MSNILKGILNESNPFYGHNDPAREYGAEDPPRFNKSRSSYRSAEDDDTFDADVAYSRKMYQLSQKQKRDADHDRLATGTNEGVRDLGYDAQSLIMKLRRDIEEKKLQPTRQAILAAARELAGDMNFAPELLVQQVLGKGVAEGILANLSYGAGRGLGKMVAGYRASQPAPPPTPAQIGLPKLNLDKTLPRPPVPAEQPVDPFKAAPTSPTLTPSQIRQQKQAAATTRARSELGDMAESQDVLTSDLQQLGQGIEEAKSSLKMGDITDKIKAAVIAATQLKGKVVKTAGGYFKVTTLDDPRPAIIAKPEYYDNLKKYQDQLKVINAAIRDIEMQFESNRREVFNDLRELFPNSPIPLKGGSSASQWLSNALANLRHTYYETNRFKTLINQKKTLEDQLKVLRDTGNRHQEQPLEEISDNNVQTRMRMDDYYDLADAIQEKLRTAIQSGNKELIHKLNKERDELDARVKQYGLMPESQLDELDTKLGLYKIAAGKDATAADKSGDYKRGHKRFKGIMKATEKEFANDARKKKEADERKSAISQGITEFTTAGGPNGPKGPTVGPKGPKGPKDYGQPNSSRYIGKNKFVVGTTLNYILTATVDKWGLEWDDDDEIWFLDSSESIDIADASEGEIELPDSVTQALTPGNIHDLVSDYLNARNSADLQKVAAYFGHSPDGEMATNEAVSNQANRFNSKQEVINHFVKNGKSAAAGAAAWERGYRGSSNKPIELKKPPQRSYHDDLDDKRYSNTFENLGNQLKSTSFEELVKAKLAIARQIEAEAEAFERDLYKNNTVQKAQQGLRREFEPTPVAQPGEKHSVLKDRLKYLDIAKQKFEKVNKLIKAIRKNYRHYEVAKKMDKLDKSLLPYVEFGPKDNYKSLFVKLSKVENELAKLYPTAAAAVADKNSQGVDEGWSQKYKSSINCSHPKGFSQKAHCAGKKKHNESIDNIMEMTCPDCGMCETHVDHTNLDEACWKGYHKEGMKTMFGKEYPDCRKNKKKTNEEALAEGNEVPQSVRVLQVLKNSLESYLQNGGARGGQNLKQELIPLLNHLNREGDGELARSIMQMIRDSEVDDRRTKGMSWAIFAQALVKKLPELITSRMK